MSVSAENGSRIDYARFSGRLASSSHEVTQINDGEVGGFRSKDEEREALQTVAAVLQDSFQDSQLEEGEDLKRVMDADEEAQAAFELRRMFGPLSLEHNNGTTEDSKFFLLALQVFMSLAANDAKARTTRKELADIAHQKMEENWKLLNSIRVAITKRVEELRMMVDKRKKGVTEIKELTHGVEHQIEGVIEGADGVVDDSNGNLNSEIIELEKGLSFVNRLTGSLDAQKDGLEGVLLMPLVLSPI